MSVEESEREEKRVKNNDATLWNNILQHRHNIYTNMAKERERKESSPHIDIYIYTHTERDSVD